jgi:hypothetical protein
MSEPAARGGVIGANTRLEPPAIGALFGQAITQVVSCKVA